MTKNAIFEAGTGCCRKFRTKWIRKWLFIHRMEKQVELEMDGRTPEEVW